MREELRAAYDDVAQIDAWVGMLAEPHRPGAMVGEMMARVLTEQFRRTRAGDRFWYTRYLPPEQVRAVEARTLSVILRAHAGVEAGDEALRLDR